MSENPKNPRDIHLRPFAIKDYDDVICLWHRVHLPFKPDGRDSRDSIEREIMHDTALFYVAEYNQHIVASIFATHDGRKGWINRLAVDPHYQRNGIGSLLITEIEKIFDQRGIHIVTCLVEAWNTNSLDFFEELGYTRHNDIIYFSKRKHESV